MRRAFPGGIRRCTGGRTRHQNLVEFWLSGQGHGESAEAKTADDRRLRPGQAAVSTRWPRGGRVYCCNFIARPARDPAVSARPWGRGGLTTERARSAALREVSGASHALYGKASRPGAKAGLMTFAPPLGGVFQRDGRNDPKERTSNSFGRQVKAPVRFEQILTNLSALGVDAASRSAREGLLSGFLNQTGGHHGIPIETTADFRHTV